MAIKGIKRIKQNNIEICPKIIWLMEVSTIIFNIMYLRQFQLMFSEFLWNLFSLYFPIIFSVFGLFLSMYQKLYIFLFTTFEFAILHTEIEAKMQPITIAKCIVFLSSHVIVLIQEFKSNGKFIMNYDINEDFNFFTRFSWVISLIFLILSNILDQRILFISFSIIFLIFLYLIAGFLVHCINIPHVEIIIFKLYLSLNIVLYSIITFIKDSKYFSIISTILSTIFISASYIWYLSGISHLPIIFIDDDLFEINKDEKAASLVEKGISSNIIENTICYCGNAYEIVSFGHKCFKNYQMNSLKITNKKIINDWIKLDDRYMTFRTIIINCDYLSIADLYIIIQLMKKFDIIIEEKCKCLVQNEKEANVTKFILYSIPRYSDAFELNESILFINDAACFNCVNLKCMTFPNSLTKIGNFAFLNCKNLKYINFKNGSRLTSIGKGAFMNTDLRVVNIPDQLNEIGLCTFKGCKKLEKIIFSDGSKMKTLNLNSFDSNGAKLIIVIPIHSMTVLDIKNSKFQMSLEDHFSTLRISS